jgi:hypothetical protein
LWYGLNKAIHQYLSGVTLQQLLDGQSKANAENAPVAMPNNASKLTQAAVQ